jgi:hypothetical protein
MEELIETIRAAVANDASTEKKTAGVVACRTILTALDTEPGKPLAMPSVLPPTLPSATPKLPISQLSLDQMLDLMIARLTVVANAADAKQQLPAATAAPTAIAPIVPAASRGMRVPTVAANIPKAVPRSATSVRRMPPRKP